MEEKYIDAIIALILGGLLIYLWMKQKMTSKVVSLEEQLLQATSLNAKQGEDISKINGKVEESNLAIQEFQKTSASQFATIQSLEKTSLEKDQNYKELKDSLKEKQDELDTTKSSLATALADNKALNEKLATQKQEMEELGKKFNLEFENIANKILETKSAKFTEQNKEQLKGILEPLGENIKEFKSKVEEVYDKESKERFSLGEKVKNLEELGLKMSEDALNLTKALKGEAKTQGQWGEMILEKILETSGLRKDEEYFLEEYLKDEEGNFLKSETEGKRMRPDAVIKYPDNRNVIIDSKVSLNAFVRFQAATDAEEQKQELKSHVQAVKKHIDQLSHKGYDDYNKALDFVLMFIPSEPAYIAAMQGDASLWDYAYSKRILLMNPTNLITALKLIVDLWKREYQNQNALEIAKRGELLLNKFNGFVENLERVGHWLGKAQKSYTDAHQQLSEGPGNLVSQATQLKQLGVKTKKELNAGMVEKAQLTDTDGQGN
jgi:DNA recombination protein RmuC